MKKKKTLKTALSCILALVLCLTNVVPVLATSNVGGTETSPADATVKKVLEMPDGTSTPGAEFTFDFTAKSVNNSTAAGDVAAMPGVPSVTIGFTAVDTGSTTDGVKTVSKESGTIFSNTNFTAAGVYKYTVTERSGTYTTGIGEIMTYSGGSYDIEVYVANGNSGVYIQAVNAVVATADNSSQTSGDKVTPTPGSSTIIFTNIFTVSSGGTDPENDSALKIGKLVAGDFADQTLYFDFTVTFNKTSAESDPITYALYLFEDGVLQATIPTGVYSGTTNDGTYDYIEAKAGTSLSFSLKHNQHLSVLSASVGTTYVVKESGTSGYTPSASVITNGGTPVFNPGAAGYELSTDTELIGMGTNSTTFTNTYQDISIPTGISMNLLPFVVLLALAAGALLLFVVAKTRKRADDSSD